MDRVDARHDARLYSISSAQCEMAQDMANTEAFYRFHRFNEAFDRNLKVTFGALEGLRTGIFPVTNARTELPIGGEPWKKLTALENPATAAESASRQTATMGIVRVTAALEDFLTTLKADMDRTSFLRKKSTALETPDTPDPWRDLDLAKACVSLNIDPNLLSSLMPLHEYFTAARNSIVHRGGRASAHLAKIAQSKAVCDCVTAWPTKRRSPVPALPLVAEGGETDWLPRHAILCVAVYYKAAVLMNEQMVSRLGPEGFIYLAAYYGLLSDDPVDGGARRSPESVILTLLQGRYRYRGVKAVDVIQTLQAADKWKICLEHFEKHRTRWRDDVASAE
jgi:hypothetical protein